LILCTWLLALGQEKYGFCVDWFKLVHLSIVLMNKILLQPTYFKSVAVSLSLRGLADSVYLTSVEVPGIILLHVLDPDRYINWFQSCLSSRRPCLSSGSLSLDSNRGGQFRPRIRLFRICDAQSDIGAGFILVLRFPLPITPPTAPHSSSSIIQCGCNRPNNGWYKSCLSLTPTQENYLSTFSVVHSLNKSSFSSFPVLPSETQCFTYFTGITNSLHFNYFLCNLLIVRTDFFLHVLGIRLSSNLHFHPHINYLHFQAIKPFDVICFIQFSSLDDLKDLCTRFYVNSVKDRFLVCRPE
jgi:hypothetical protein